MIALTRLRDLDSVKGFTKRKIHTLQSTDDVIRIANESPAFIVNLFSYATKLHNTGFKHSNDV